MPSKAHAKFIKTIRRCESLAESYKTLHEMTEEEARPPAPKDIVRGAVVLAVAALDTYVTDVFTEKLVPYIKKFTPDDSLVNLLEKAGLDTRETLTLLAMDRPYRRIRTLVQSYYNSYTTQKFDVIDEIFLPFRLKSITANAEAKTKRKALKKSIGKLVERRHQIVHAGDYNAHGRIVDIDQDRMAKRIKNLELLVTSMDEIICNRI